MKRFAVFPLNAAAHGIDGRFELWRDTRIDDAFVKTNWSALTFHEGMPPAFATVPPAKALIAVVHSDGRLADSMLLPVPLATIEEVRLGDDPTPYVMVSIDTFDNGGAWDGTAHGFAKIVGGVMQWPHCAEVHRGMRVGFQFDPRPSGGNDILSYWISTDNWTELKRIQVDGTKCRAASRKVTGMRCETSPCAKPAEYPPR